MSSVSIPPATFAVFQSAKSLGLGPRTLFQQAAELIKAVDHKKVGWLGEHTTGLRVSVGGGKIYELSAVFCRLDGDLVVVRAGNNYGQGAVGLVVAQALDVVCRARVATRAGIGMQVTYLEELTGVALGSIVTI